MSRVAYSATKDVFINDVKWNRFIPKMRVGAKLNHIGSGDSEIRSWQSNAPSVRNLLELSQIPDDIIVSFEYKVPNGGRIDCMLYGEGNNGLKNVIHIELKQWGNNSVSELYDTGVFKVDAFTGGSYRAVCHPSQQVLNYQTHLLNFVEELNADDTNLEGLAYCYNYDSNATPNALYANHYRAILDQHRLYSGNEIEPLAARIHELLCNGSGLEIFNRVTTSRIRQSKTLLDAAANMFKGITEFSLLDDQITASETIFAEVRKASKKKGKTVIIVKGGPGTGKTVIALHVLAQMAQEGKASNMYFTTRSKALRESLRERLQNISLQDGNKLNASDLISNIFHFKPHYYEESEVDLLLVDEAHRVQKSANYMGDKFFEQTYLSQVTSLIYCSKVCVFFIDDKQAIKTDEIGNSDDIEAAARNYANSIADYANSDFYQKIQKNKKSLSKAESDRVKLAAHTIPENYGKIAKLDAKISELRREITKEDCIADVRTTLTTPINIIQLELKSQFRCNGSDNYLDWLDEVLYKPYDLVKTSFSNQEYDFQIFGTPQALYDKIKSLDNPNGHPKQVARIAAGYCWRWSTQLAPGGDLIKDVKIGDFEMPWETNNVRARGQFRDKYASSADTWAIEPQGINQVGCIFSIQGFEIDYIGVILGPDIQYDSLNDCLIGQVGNNVAVQSSDSVEYTRHIRNAYRVLMSRGKKGCFVYCCNPEVATFLERCQRKQADIVEMNTGVLMAAEEEPSTGAVIIDDYDFQHKTDKTGYIPLYSVRAACGYFEDGEVPEVEGWIDASGYGFRPDPKKHFVVHAKGDSMQPKIHDGDLCVFEWYQAGSRNGEIVLTQCQERDLDYGGMYTIKRYQSEKVITEEGWYHSKVELEPLNNNYEVIELDLEREFKTIGIFKCVLSTE